ncbi:MAG: hypothetical protein HN778_02850 [Prolixibacteraceae bacterium]|jgi:branched-subunit amino acid aminotransferase/4-amino-4-deoxychorismate lyase|nr:hypothetical protein [Prolixibacteraceae bacterium]MBT6006800.1 hypothetical protein [Prolixibacteraceae bacterium]MBT6765788.1 hypothetical protein [Prolixibacteraceae bacterium]MBT6997203.1 hypothetical protein [Prolixibacteraceae bacterium]MBT7393750.1 hypothetical protein [Prolixibacteraceae bacterium]
MDFLIADNKIIHKDDINFIAFFWGEPFVLSQKMWFGYGGIPLFQENIDLLFQQIELLNLPLPELIKNTKELFRITKRMLNKNKFYRSGLIHLQLFWHDSQINSVITSLAFPEFDFPFSKHGLLLNYSSFKKHSEISLNRFSFYNSPLWKASEGQLRDSHFQNSVFLNENNFICECINANIFMIKENMLITPSLQTGCFEDKLRNTILGIATNINLKVVESAKIKKEDLTEMDEIFLASEENGVQWVLGVENKRFLHLFSAKIHEKLNEYLKGPLVSKRN